MQQSRQLASVVGFYSISSPRDDGVWQRVEGRHAHCGRFRQSHPHRRCFPEDLCSKFFNCFSSGHCAAMCHRPTCYFRCSEHGHRSSDSPCRLAVSRQPRLLARRVAWHPTPTPDQRTAPSPPDAARQPPPLFAASVVPQVSAVFDIVWFPWCFVVAPRDGAGLS
jgi:hypothetical protein